MTDRQTDGDGLPVTDRRGEGSGRTHTMDGGSEMSHETVMRISMMIR